MAPAIDYERELNEAQYKAVTTLLGPQLVIAGAGTGKTRTLVYRVAYLVERGSDPRSIVLLTFTRKAAQEMMHRASLILDARCAMVSGGTFHSFANLMLRRYAVTLGYSSNFTIVDRSDAEDILNLLRTERGFHKDKKRFPRKNALLNMISRAANTGLPLDQVVTEDYPQFLERSEDIARLAEAYAAYKRKRSIMDYDDLLIQFRRLLKEDENVRNRICRQYDFFMVDEFQDTNRVQGEIARLLASEHHNLMVVGDDSQSIYSFRGADFRNIMEFPKHFPDCIVTTLEQNYRSTQPILSLTNAIIANARQKYSKNLFSLIPGDTKPVYVRPASEVDQARFVSAKVRELLARGIPASDIAVLFRAGWHSNELEIHLQQVGLPFVKYGGVKFVEAAHVKDVLAICRAAMNPRDAIAWHRVLPFIEGIGPVTSRKIIQAMVDSAVGTDALLDSAFSGKKYGEDLKRLHETLQQVTAPNTGPSEKIGTILDYYDPILKRLYDDAHKRANDLTSLVQIAKNYSSLEALLSDLVLDPPERSLAGVREKEPQEGRIVLSTIHSAKGLEWHSVFIIHLVDGYLPSSYAFSSEDALEEERRLFYVAATRAKRNLYLSSPKVTGRGSFYAMDPGGPSRFLFEIKNLGVLVQRPP